ncbi:MAG: SusD/RagB family nutrient-binding outer membrane lipoprotein [Citrobacter freundii]|nr:MAG: SusD/RagB family nutrient-binding outer membrane lipoprotein [Citrobacter freundii]
MKKVFVIIITALLFASCKKDLTTLNEDPKNPPMVAASSLVTNAERSLVRTLSSSNVNLNIFRLIVQHWQETTYLGESRYDLNTRNIPQGVWTALYRDVLKDLEEAKRLIPEQVTDGDVKTNQLAVVNILQVYAYYYLINTFGNIPYSEALDIDNVFPKYDDAATIYTDLIARLNTAITSIKPAANGLGNADIIYGNDMTAWAKFGNSFKLKMGMLIADVPGSNAQTIVEQAYAAGVFSSNDDNALFDFLASPPNTNPIWEDLVQSGRQDFVAASTLVDQMQALNDPRVPLYFTPDEANDYSGGDPGTSSSYTTFSKPDEKITVPEFPGVLLDYSEVEFLLAEAAARGWAVGGAAALHYSNAITASILFWGGTQNQATTYLARPAVNYATAAGSFRQKIGTQKWIALYNRGWDAWIEWRRLDYPQLAPAFRALSAIPLRFTYPVNEQNYNTTNYNQAADAIGGDEVDTKLWWDVN